MENLKTRLEKVIEEHQRESGLHMVGGREKLVGRLLEALAADATCKLVREGQQRSS